MGGVVKNVVGAVEDVVEGAGDIVQDVVIDPVVELGSNLEDGIRKVVDEADKLVQNPYVQTVVSAINPAAGAFLNAYATLDSGENLSPAQVAALAAAGYTTASGTTIPSDVQQALDAGTAIAEGGDAKDILLKTYGSDFVSELGLDTEINTALTNTFGEDVVNLVSNNLDYVDAAARYVAGDDPSEIIVDKFGGDIVGLLGSDDPSVNALGYAGLKTAVGLDQGLDQDDALLAGAEEYYQRGGQLPDAGQIASLAGIEDVDFDYNKLVGNLGLDFSGLSGMGYDLRGLGDLGIDLNKINLTTPDIFDSGLNLGEVADLGLDLSGVDFSGYSTADLGDYNLKQLQDLGVDLTQLNLRPEFQMIGLAELMEGDVPGGVPLTEGEELATLTPDLDFLNEGDEIPLPRQILSKPV